MDVGADAVSGIENQFSKSSTATPGGSLGVSRNKVTDKQMAVGCKGVDDGDKTGDVPPEKIDVDDDGGGRMKAADEEAKIEGENTAGAQTMEFADEGKEVEGNGSRDVKNIAAGQGPTGELEFLQTTLTRLRQGASRGDIEEDLSSRISFLERNSLAVIKQGGNW